jgi:hypothetical protein
MSKIKLQNVRLSFPSLFRKAVFNGDETKYEATFMLDKTEHADLIKQIDNAVAGMMKDAFKGAKIPADKICLKDGDDSGRSEYEGHMTIKASNAKRPLVIDRDKTPLGEGDNRIYSGCYVNGIVELWAQNNQWGKRINANLLAVQFFRDGDPFGDGTTASVDDFDAFDDVEMDDFV